MRKFQTRWLAAMLAILPQLHAGSPADELTPAQKSCLLKGEQVTVLEKVEGKPWPRVRLYRVVNATPEEGAAVFFDFETAKSFVPNLLKSSIANRVSPTILDVDYGIDIPILPDEYYTTRNTLTRQGDSFRFEWKLLRAAQTKDSEGSFRLAPYGDRAVFCYENLVTPGSAMAPLLRGKAIDQMEKTVAAIAAQIERQKASQPADLDRQVQALRAALCGQ